MTRKIIQIAACSPEIVAALVEVALAADKEIDCTAEEESHPLITAALAALGKAVEG